MSFANFFAEYWWQLALVAVLSYTFGCVNYAVVFSKAFKHCDIRTLGSKNAGTTNMFRVFGLRMGALTFVCDALKGVIPCLLCLVIFKNSGMQLQFAYWAGLFAVVGHVFPVLYRWRGGKGVATSIGVCFAVQPLLSLCCVLPAIAIILIFDRMSVMSLLLSVFMIVWHWCVLFDSVQVTGCVFATVTFSIVILAHWQNIIRIFSGKELKTGVRKSIFGRKK